MIEEAGDPESVEQVRRALLLLAVMTLRITGNRPSGVSSTASVEEAGYGQSPTMQQGALACRRTSDSIASRQLITISDWRIRIPLFDVTILSNTFKEIERGSGIVLSRARLSTAGSRGVL